MGPEECIQCGNVFNIFSNEFTKNSVSCSAMPYCAWNPICQWGPFYIFPLIPYLSLDIPKELLLLAWASLLRCFPNYFFGPLIFLFTFDLTYFTGFAITLTWKTVLLFLDTHLFLLRVTLTFYWPCCASLNYFVFFLICGTHFNWASSFSDWFSFSLFCVGFLTNYCLLMSLPVSECNICMLD